MLTPWIVSNRTVFATTYHVHSESIDGHYSLVRSSEGNTSIADEHAERIGDDVEADLTLFWVNVNPITATSSRINFAVKINLGGSLPQRIREMISSKQSGFIDMMAKYFESHKADMDASFAKNE